jgi:epoxyqueuosine reductase
MKYLEACDEAGNLKRASLKHTAPWARSVIVCAINYNTAQPYSTQVHDPDCGWISRYAWSREDYHDAVMRRLREVEGQLRAAFVSARRFSGAESATASPIPLADAPTPASKNAADDSELITRCYVDTGPLVERVYAKYAGIGWIAKNTCIINQQLGSWLFLGVILTSLEVSGCASQEVDAPDADRADRFRLTPDVPAPDRCGTCTRCIDACPTDALIAPYQLDSNLCISYLTIEKRGEIPAEMRAGLGRHVFGCDICQDVCPWNRKAPATSLPEFQPREGLVNPALEWLAEISAEDFQKTFRGSPIRRTKRNGLRRNAIIAMGNSGHRKFIPLLNKLAADEDPVIAASAGWATARLEANPGEDSPNASGAPLSHNQEKQSAPASSSRDSI